MPLEFLCPFCGEQLTAEPNAIGDSIHCSQCESEVVVQATGVPAFVQQVTEDDLADFTKAITDVGGDILLTTCETVTGRPVQDVLGLVESSVVMSRHVGADLMAGVKALVGGEIAGYSQLLNSARWEARRRLTGKAIALKAHAIVGVRYATASIYPGMCEMLVYGTAVRLSK